LENFNKLFRPLIFLIILNFTFLLFYTIFFIIKISFFLFSKKSHKLSNTIIEPDELSNTETEPQKSSNAITLKKKISFAFINVLLFLPFSGFLNSTLSILDKKNNFFYSVNSKISNILALGTIEDPKQNQIIVKTLIDFCSNNYSNPVFGFSYIMFNPDKLRPSFLDSMANISEEYQKRSEYFFNNKTCMDFYFNSLIQNIFKDGKIKYLDSEILDITMNKGKSFKKINIKKVY
jgi:hypothetical protein